MRLRDRLPVLWQAPTQVRIGTDPRWAVVLSDLSPGAVRALTGLPTAAPERAVRAALRTEGATTAEADAVVAHLRTARLLVADGLRESPDAAALALLEADGSAGEVLARRGSARVRVSGLGRLGATVVATLAAAGVGHLVLDDPETIGRHEAGWAGLVPDDVGIGRPQALASALRRAGRRTQTAVGGDPPVDLVVLVEHATADPTRHRPLMSDGVTHLSVVLREASVLVGPLVQPGVSPCLRCVDLHRTELDPHWPALAAQLAVQRPSCEESVLAAVGGSLAAAQALAWVDGRSSAVAGGALEVRLPEAVPRLIRWRAHPDCGCTCLG